MKLTNEPHVPDAFDAWMVALQMNLPKTAFVAQSAQVDLRDTYLDNVPDRQHHNCRCCLSFLYKYGDTYWYDESGTVQTIWRSEGVPKMYKKTAAALHEAVVNSVKTGDPLATLPRNIGEKATGQFTHFYAVLPMEQDQAKVVHYREAMKRMNYALAEGFNVANLQHIQAILAVASAARKDIIKGMLEFCINYAQASPVQRVKLVANAHDGLTHPKGSTLGMLIESLRNGVSTEGIIKQFNASTDPLKHQRPQAAPKVGTIQAAERLFNEMRLGPSLFRRCINRSDIPQKAYIWKPKSFNQGVKTFGHLMPGPKHQLPERRMTWATFQKELLPMTEWIEWYGGPTQPITVMTAEHPSAPPILRWDTEEERNTFAWYFPGSAVSVQARKYPVHCILSSPDTWGAPYPAARQQVLLMTDRLYNTIPHSGLFPECLRHELREVRSVIEANNLVQGFLSNLDSQEAQGVVVSNTKASVRLQVTTRVGTLDVVIDYFA